MIIHVGMTTLQPCEPSRPFLPSVPESSVYHEIEENVPVLGFWFQAQFMSHLDISFTLPSQAYLVFPENSV
jgi:hypothetical protein